MPSSPRNFSTAAFIKIFFKYEKYYSPMRSKLRITISFLALIIAAYTIYNVFYVVCGGNYNYWNSEERAAFIALWTTVLVVLAILRPSINRFSRRDSTEIGANENLNIVIPVSIILAIITLNFVSEVKNVIQNMENDISEIGQKTQDIESDISEIKSIVGN